VADQVDTPVPAGLLRPVQRPVAASADFTRELGGYVVWGLTAGVIASFELWAAIGTPPWATISATVGHLEAQPGYGGLVAILVVALIVLGAAQAVGYSWSGAYPLIGRDSAAQRASKRTKTGRLTMRPSADRDELSPLYILLALVVVGIVAWVVIVTVDDSWHRSYWIYGSIALLLVIFPNALAFFSKSDVPFPTLFRTIANLERHARPVALVVLAGLVVLLIHLAFYPWPHVPTNPTSSSP
jgi:hypothetical protein